MLKLGEKQKLQVVKKVDFGIYLAEREDDETRVLLPKKQVPEGIRIGDQLTVFLYKDSKDRLHLHADRAEAYARWSCGIKSGTGRKDRRVFGLGT